MAPTRRSWETACRQANLDNCNILSNTGMTCHGHNTGATNGDAHKTNNGCGNTQNSNVPVLPDPYKSLASNIPPDTCGGSYPQESGGLQTKWSGAKTLPATTIVCADLQLTADTTLTTASPGSVLVIENGQLDTNNKKLATVAGSALTLIFSGTAGSYTHAPTGGGTLDFNAPTSGTWSGVAIYQDPTLTTGVDISAAGNSPTWIFPGSYICRIPACCSAARLINRATELPVSVWWSTTSRSTVPGRS